MQRLGLEWMFRLLQELKRLWRRYLVDFVSFIPIVILEWGRVGNTLRNRGTRDELKESGSRDALAGV